MLWVIKIGGSLFPNHAADLLTSLSGEKVVVITGGGVFSNLIRDLDKKFSFSSTATHNSAILSMDILSILLADKVPSSELIYDIDSIEKTLDSNKTPILACSNLINDFDFLEHSWDVTSDSISLCVANMLKAKLLITTDVDGIYTRKLFNKDIKLLYNINAKKLLTFGETSVDASLAKLLLKFESNCYIANGKYPDRIISIIHGCNDKNNKYTFIRGD